MAGVTFSLHKEKSVDGVVSIDLTPETGYDRLVTDANGVIPGIDNTLPAGTYELWETTPDGYQPISRNGHIRFKVSETGAITLVATQDQPIPDGVTLSGPVEQNDGSVAYIMTVLNRRQTNISLKKVDDKNKELKGSQFALYKYTGSWVFVSGYETIDLTSTATAEIKNLTSGLYCLTETKAPDGYVIVNNKVYFKISFSDAGAVVTLTDEEGSGSNANDQASISQNSTTLIYTVTVKNIPGAALPSCGGPGTRSLFILGGMLVTLAGGILFMRIRRESL